jgi:hypothetical protein
MLQTMVPMFVGRHAKREHLFLLIMDQAAMPMHVIGLGLSFSIYFAVDLKLVSLVLSNLEDPRS